MAENLPARKMKPICLIAVLATLVNYVWAAEESRDIYSPRYDIINVDAILGSKRLVTNYADCLLNKKPCPPEGKDLKRILPEALRTKCAKCSVYQKENALKIITALYYQYPENYNRLAEKWDPTGEYNKRFEEYLANKEFNQIGSDDPPPPSSSVSSVVIQQVQVQQVTAPRPRPTTTTTTSTARPTQAPFSQPQIQTQPQIVAQQFFPQFFQTQRPTTRPTTRAPEVRPTTRAPEVRPTSAPSAYLDFQTSTNVVENKVPVAAGVANRFGFDDADTGAVSVVTNRSPIATTSRRVPPTTRPTAARPQIPTIRPFQNPVLAQFFNEIGNRLATTAELIAGMVRNTVRVIIGGVPVSDLRV